MQTLIDNLARIFQSRQSSSLGPDVRVGFETRVPAHGYRWDGLRRGGDPRHPFLVFQYTLAGHGVYESPSAVHRVTPGMAFAAIIPSQHVYYLPPDSAHWTFFWVILRHPYIVKRIKQCQQTCNATVMSIASDSVLITKALRLFQGVCEDSFRDELDAEQSQFELLIEYERLARHQTYPQERRQQLLEETRTFVLKHLSHPLTVEQLAQRRQMSRSHFGHYFHATTGLSPARFITETRLQEVSHRLAHTADTLKRIASETGFADANHLCKVFRRFYHLSPGAYRRQMR
jgi:AraC-like DNA-binding protein